MADIDVVPKRGTKTWLWIVLALVVIAVLWMLFGGQSSPASGRLIDGVTGPGTPIPAAVVPAA
jgi:hypothetical protein